MPRTIIDIPDPQIHEVDRLCKRMGISRAEAVRRALRDFVSGHDNIRIDGFGLWKAQPEGRRPGDGSPHGDAT
jgi:hypothetical protein